MRIPVTPTNLLFIQGTLIYGMTWINEVVLV